MTNREQYVYLASILTTIADSERDGLPVPLGPMYAALIGRIGYNEWETLMAILVHGGLAVKTDETIRLTDEGRKLAARCAEVVR